MANPVAEHVTYDEFLAAARTPAKPARQPKVNQKRFDVQDQVKKSEQILVNFDPTVKQRKKGGARRGK